MRPATIRQRHRMPSVETRTVEPDEAGMRLDRWFHVHFPELGFGHLQKLIRSGQVRVDGGRVKTNTRLEPGQAVRVPPLAEPGDGRRGVSRRAGEPATLSVGPVTGVGRRSSGPKNDEEFLRS